MRLTEPAVHRAASSAPEDEIAITRREGFQAVPFGLALVWINAYICRELFWQPTAYMNSMHGFWIALAKRAGDSWFQPTWWPYWDCGIPFEFTYAPLVPALTAAWAALGRVSPTIAFQSLTAVVYCLLPLTLFLMAWRLTRAPVASFLAALFYSLTAITTLIVPDDRFALQHFWDARRLYLLTVWDDLPHAAALALLPLVILFLERSIRRRRFRYYIPTVLLIALMAVASQFGVIEVAMAALCLLFVCCRHEFRRTITVTVCLGIFAYAVVAPFLPPSLGSVIVNASGGRPGAGEFSLSSVTALAIVALGWAILWHYLSRWTHDWKLQFFVLFAYLTSSVPVLAAWLNREFVPQPGRYKFEMELAWSLLVVFALRPWFTRAARPIQVTLLGLLLALAGEQVASHRKFAKAILQPRDDSQTIEARTAIWAEQNLPGVRVMMPGTIAQWANDFTGIAQFSGSSWSQAANQVQQRGLAAVLNGGDTPERDARVSLAWLKAYGVGAVAVSGPKSQELWKPYAHPAKFEGLLPVLWRADDVAIYRVPQRTTSLAHVVPPAAIVTRSPAVPGDIADIEAYVNALEDPSLPAAEFRWEGSNHIRIRTSALGRQAISVQVSYHRGWHAHSGGRALPLKSDGLGLMWLQPECSGSCEVQLDYDGGWELRLCRYLSYAAILALFVVPLARGFARLRPNFFLSKCGK
jgi:hypothetical protein